MVLNASKNDIIIIIIIILLARREEKHFFYNCESLVNYSLLIASSVNN